MTPEEKAAREYTDHFAFYQEWIQPSYIHHEEWVKDTAHYFEAFAYVVNHADKTEESIRAALLAYYRMLEPPAPPPPEPERVPGPDEEWIQTPMGRKIVKKQGRKIADLTVEEFKALFAEGIIR